MTKLHGIGVMLNQLTGEHIRSASALKDAMGKQITSLSLSEDSQLRIKFSDGTGLRIWDDGQSCCESRYTRTDDDLSAFVGANLLDVAVRDGGGTGEEDGDYHDIQFLVLSTDRGDITFSSHNEHNGYYGGFSLSAVPLEDT